MADQFDAFQKEVEEDLQRERFQKMWEQYGTYILGAAAAFVLAVAAYKFQENRRQAAAEANAASYITAVRALGDNKTDEAQKALAAVASQKSGYGLLARMRLAAADAAAGQTDKAVAAYDLITREAGVDKLVSDYARLQSAMLTADKGDWTDLQNRLNPLVDENNPWKHSARELLGLAALKAGNLTEARSQLEKLVADPRTPAGIGERAGIMMAEIVQTELAKAQPAAPVSPAQPATPAPQSTPAAQDSPGKKKK